MDLNLKHKALKDSIIKNDPYHGLPPDTINFVHLLPDYNKFNIIYPNLSFDFSDLINDGFIFENIIYYSEDARPLSLTRLCSAGNYYKYKIKDYLTNLKDLPPKFHKTKSSETYNYLTKKLLDSLQGWHKLERGHVQLNVIIDNLSINTIELDLKGGSLKKTKIIKVVYSFDFFCNLELNTDFNLGQGAAYGCGRINYEDENPRFFGTTGP